MKLRSLIVDDEDLARENLKILLEDFCPEIEVIGDAGNITKAKELIEELKPDVVFLDIRMPSGSEGFELLESIERRDFMVVFVTAFKDYAIRAFNANAVHYVLKPVDIDDLKTSVEKLVESKKSLDENPGSFQDYNSIITHLADSLKNNKPSSRITISHTKGLKIVNDSDIRNLEASGNCTTIYFGDGTCYLDTRTLKIYEGLLDDSKFFRVHKSHIVNMDYLQEYLSEDGHFAVLNDGTRLPIARNRLSTFLTTIKSM